MNQGRSFADKKAGRRLLGLALGGLVSLGAQGQAVVDPSTQPFFTLAPYVLESSNLEPRIGNPEGGTYAYRPWFENGAWTGDLIQYYIDKDGRRAFTGGIIGQYPRDGEGWNTMGELWSARYVFPDYEPYTQTSETDATWFCTDEDGEYYKNRNIFTLNSDSGTKVPFFWDQISDAQRQVIDSEKFTEQAGTNQDPSAEDSRVLSFLRGDRSNERCKEAGTYRWRFSLLGAIVNSRPVHVPTSEGQLVIVGANDGMLHAFRAHEAIADGATAAAGEEVWAYIPTMLMNKLGALRDPRYKPTYYVDGELRHANIGTVTTPRHMVAGGLGAGGRGLFIIDVTTPSSPQVVLELAGETAPYLGGSVNDNIGHIHGRPTIAKLQDNNWYAIFGNGNGSTNGSAALVLVPLTASGAGIPRYVPAPEQNDTFENGLSAPALIDSDGDALADTAYAGDLKGNLYRFDLSSPASVSVRTLFQTDALTLGSKPITVEPDVTRHPAALPGFMVYFGTGSLLSAADSGADNLTTQSIYGIWDRPNTATVLTNETTIVNSSAAHLETQTLGTAQVPWDVPEATLCPVVPTNPDGTPQTLNTATVRFVASATKPSYVVDDPDSNLGWRVDLDNRPGERLIGRPQVRAERLQFITTNPYDMLDEVRRNAVGSGSWVLQLDLGSGATADLGVVPSRTSRPLFDLNENCSLDSLDGAPTDLTTLEGFDITQGSFPIGVNIGALNVSQPAFARVSFSDDIGSVVDGVYINALALPPPPPPNAVVNGPLDVTTDSAFGDAHTNVEYEPVKAPFFSDTGQATDFPAASGPTKDLLRADGLGHRVDGHSFAYNKHHAVDYVDFFNLEPRRLKLRRDWGQQYLDANDDYQTIPSGAISERELNRVTEVEIGSSTKFIVAITNADLSRDNEIQIGTRTWPVYEYQTELMTALRSTNPIDELEEQDLIFTLCGAENPIGVPDSDGECIGTDTNTLRITPTARIGDADATMHTLPGCVNNTDHYKSQVNNQPATTRKDALNNDIPSDLYLVDPHATPALEPTGQDKKNPREWEGYRWRNGALTVQLIAVPTDGNALPLQEETYLPTKPGAEEGLDLGWGGVYAKAFDIVTEQGQTFMRPVTEGGSQPAQAISGMLYELSMFWHWGDMARFQTSGNIYPVCLGAPGHKPRAMFEGNWFASGQYLQLVDKFSETDQITYENAVRDLRSDDETVVRAALETLDSLFMRIDGLADYHRLRHYVANSKQLNAQTLITIDKGLSDIDVTIDGTPAPVVDIEADLLPSLGPNYQPGRRSWIDISPE